MSGAGWQRDDVALVDGRRRVTVLGLDDGRGERQRAFVRFADGNTGWVDVTAMTREGQA